MVTRSHTPLPGDRFRLPSGRIVMVVEIDEKRGEPAARCEYADGQVVTLTCMFLVRHGWRLA